MNVLYVQQGPGLGGSKISLYHMLKCAPSSQRSYIALAFPKQREYEKLIKPHVEEIYNLDIPTWQRYNRRTSLEKFREPFGDAIRLLKLIPAARRIKEIIASENIDLVHTNNSVTAVGAFAAWLAKKPHVWHVRESFGVDRQFEPILGDKISYWLIKKLSHEIICNSAYTSELFEEFQIHHLIIPNGLDLYEFSKKPVKGNELRSKYRIDKGALVIGMVGNLGTELKRHDIFLALAGELAITFPNLKFIVFGKSKNLDQTAYTKRLRSLAQELNLENKVIWAGFEDQPAAIMNSMDIMVHPALTEGSGRVVMEAMAAGIPVVAMRSGGVKELIHDGETGFLLEPGNIDKMATKIKMLLECEDLRKKIGDNARKYANEHFSDQATMDAIVKVYQNIIQG